MGLDTALSSANLTSLAGPSRVRRYLSVDNDTTSATARINQASFSYPLTQLTVDGTSNWSDVAANQTVFIGSSAGGHDKGIYRVRKAGTADTLELMQISAGDTGAMNRAMRYAAFADNDYITVFLNRFDPWAVLPRVDFPGDASAASVYEDYDRDVSTNNTTPGPRVSVTINGTPDRWAGMVDAGQTYRTVVIVITGAVWPTSSSISSYDTAGTSAWTITAGAVNTSTFTARVPHSATPYLISITVEDDNGATTTVKRKVWSHSTTYPPIVVSGAVTDTIGRTGMTLSLTLNDNVLASIPQGAYCHYWEEGTWSGNDVTSAITAYAGWINKINGSAEPSLRSAEISIIGPTGLMAMLGGSSHRFTYAASPANWTELPAELMNIDFVLYWLLLNRATGLLQLFNYVPFGAIGTNGRLSDWRIDGGNGVSLYAQCQKLADMYGGNFGCDPGGEFFARRHPSRLSLADRVLATVIRGVVSASTPNTFVTTADARPPSVRRLRGEGYYGDGQNSTTRVWCDAPGQREGQGTREEKYQNQVADFPSELYERVGNEYAMRNNPYPAGAIKSLIEKNWHVFKPAQMQLWSLAIPAANRPDGQIWGELVPSGVTLSGAINNAVTSLTASAANSIYTHMIIHIDDEDMLVTGISGTTKTVTRGYNGTTAATHSDGATIYRRQMAIVSSVSRTHYENGTVDVSVEFEGETVGIPAIDVPIPPEPNNTYGAYSTAPIVSTVAPNWGEENGAVPVSGTAGGPGLLFATADGYVIRGGETTFTSISPTAEQRASIGTTIKMIADPWNYKGLILYGSQGGLICDDASASSPVWRTVNLAGSASTGVWTQIFDFTVDDYGWAGYPGGAGAPPGGSYSPGVGFEDTTESLSGRIYRSMGLSRSMSERTITDIEITYDISSVGTVNTPGDPGAYYTNSTLTGTIGTLKLWGSITTGTNQTFAFSGSEVLSAINVYFGVGVSAVGGADPGGSGAITRIAVSGSDTNPFGGSGGGSAEDEIFIGDIQGSINRKGYFCWLAKRTVSATDYVYFTYTTDYFRTRKSVQVAKWDDTINHTVSLSSYNSGSTGVIYVTAGTTGDSTAKRYSSDDWGVSWSAESPALNTDGGLVNIPYNNSGGTANAGTAPVFGLVKGNNAGDLEFIALDGTTNVIAATSNFLQGPFAMGSYTLDGDVLNLILDDGSMYTSPDGGVTWAAQTSISGGASFVAYGVTGWPTNPAFLLAFGYRALTFSDDAAATWTSLWATYDTWRSSNLGSSDGETIVTAFGDLSRQYGREVTSV